MTMVYMKLKDTRDGEVFTIAVPEGWEPESIFEVLDFRHVEVTDDRQAG